MTARALLGRLLLAFALAPAVAAQSPHTVEIGGFVRNTWFDDQLPVDEKIGGGASIGVFVLRNFAIEAEGSYLKSNGPLGNDISNTRLLGRLVYNVPLGGYASAFQIGAGYVRNMYGETADADENGVHVLVGLRIGFTEHLALRVAGTVDAIPTPKLVPATGENYNHGVQAGLSLLFGNSYDRDKDGVKDKADKCPDTPAGEEVDASGCSASQRDSDGDKVKDNTDKCPNTPAGESVDANGCSSTQLDDDKEGVPNAADACPGTEAGTAVDQRGCPALFKGPERTVILKGVNFQFNRAKLTPDSRDTLMEVAKSLAGSPDVHVEVAGYTDSQGDNAYNQRLSQRRAEAVEKFLVDNGVSPAQLTARGYGESKPLASNKTASGRAQNRRVELNRTN
jgi:OOP family OmpA-OmpF porin